MSVSADSDGHGFLVLGVSLQGPVLRIVGERAATGAQVIDHGLRGTGNLPGLARTPWGVCVAGEQDGQSCQVGQDLVLANIRIPGPGGSRGG